MDVKVNVERNIDAKNLLSLENQNSFLLNQYTNIENIK